MKLFEKQNNIPTLNIESIGCKVSANIRKFYIPSLTYKIDKWFRNYEKTIYIPILFNDDNAIKEIFQYYNNLYFTLKFSDGCQTHYSKQYHISEIINLLKIIKNEHADVIFNINYNIYICFTIKYNNYDIQLLYIPFSGFSLTDNEKINILLNYDNKNILEIAKYNYFLFPQINCYLVHNKDLNEPRHSVSESIKYIDLLIEAKNKMDQTIESMYSKKTFKLVENS